MQGFIEEDFKKAYRGSTEFVNKSQLYFLFLDLLKDDVLIEKIKFANDYLKEPPLKSFMYYCRNEKKTTLFDNQLEVFEKQGIGACFGYLYRFMYNEKYIPRQCLINDKQTGIITCSRFEKGE